MSLLKSLGHAIVATLKRVYDIFATYLLFWLLYVAGVAVALHVGFEWLWQYLGVENPELVWSEMALALPLDVEATKLAVTLALQVLVFVVVRRPIAVLQPIVEKTFDATSDFFGRVTNERWSMRLFGESLFTVVISALLVPFVIQPTLVRGWDPPAWSMRATNLIDGTAVLDLPDSVVGYYRRFTAEAVVAQRGVSADELQSAFANAASSQRLEDHVDAGTEPPPSEEVMPGVAARRETGLRVEVKPLGQPVMDRWDNHIVDAVDHNEELFAYVKAFMYVESAGRQYAVSRTGCAGLMQFCSGTAKSEPYRSVFGTGNVYACGCRGSSCVVPKDVQVALESGDPELVDQQEDKFPCELTDARFDPDKALGAGSVYIKRLHRAYGGNIYLMYIGYNSGPGVANRVFRAVDQNPGASLDEIEAQLTAALQPYYGTSSGRRARSLVKVHLPKIERAHLRFGGQSVEQSPALTMAIDASLEVCGLSVMLPGDATLLAVTL